MSVKDLSNYAELSAKQKIANKYLKDARTRLGENNKYYKNAVNRINKFQKKIGKKESTRMTLTKVTEETSRKYEDILDSIIESTYINPEKYETHKEKQLQFAIDTGWAKSREEAERVYDFANSELMEQLKDIGRGDIPSAIIDKYAEYVQGNLSEEEFINMANEFLEGYSDNSENSLKYNQFFDFADTYAEYYSDFEKVVQAELANGFDSGMRFTDLYRDGLFNMEDIRKAMEEYASADLMDMSYSFLGYLREFYL